MLKKQTISRRQFIQLSAMSGGALLLAACGGGAPAESEPAAPSAAASNNSAIAESDVQVMVGDVLSYTLDSDEWTGMYGSVTFRIHEGRVDEEPIYYIRTDASDPTYAEENKLVYVPLLNAAGSLGIANDLYLFDSGRPAILRYGPGHENYSSLFQVHRIAGGGSYNSAADIDAAVDSGSLELDTMTVFVNHPIVKWPGGELAVDPDLTETLGPGQLFERVNTENMTVTMKLHQCYPGSRYIVTDSSAMAPMMNINAASPTQQLKDAGGTDEIWVFANGIPGSGVMGFQPAVFDNKAGEPAWSPFWDHFTVKWVDESQARLLTSSTEIREAIEAGELELFNGVPDSHPNGFVVNCPAPILAPNDFTA